VKRIVISGAVGLGLLGCVRCPAGAQSEWVHPGPDGKLVYKTTAAGDKIMDFSHAGYMGESVALPEVPTRIPWGSPIRTGRR
jgi:hypothetical protein